MFSISPIIVFVVIYLATSIIAGDFYKVPITVTFMLSSIYAIAATTGKSINERIEIFSKGAGQPDIMMMLWIFVLAGAFAHSAKAMGCIDATVQLTLSALPSNTIYAGLFLSACFVSISIGTSVGTIAALTPIAVGLAEATGSNTAFITSIVVGGSFFGDNLSFISDTTVAATQSQGCKMDEKFKANLRIVAVAAVISLLIYIYIGRNVSSNTDYSSIEYYKILPYILVLIVSILGVNVMTVLTVGIILTAVIGFSYGEFDLYSWFGSMGEGIVAMGELVIVTLLAGGLLAVVKVNGGIDYILRITSLIRGRRGAECCIAFLVSVINLCTANNTIAIITVGSIARSISEKYNISPRRTASILDTFSCVVQGLIPYGAQILIASGLSGVNPVSIVSYMYYPLILALIAVGYIVVVRK